MSIVSNLAHKFSIVLIREPFFRNSLLKKSIEIQNAHIKHPIPMRWIITSSEAVNIYIAEATKKTTRSGDEQCSDSGKGDQIFITLLPIWLLGQRSG